MGFTKEFKLGAKTSGSPTRLLGADMWLGDER
jgi:hypothetical protein